MSALPSLRFPLRFPLTKKALAAAFAALEPESVELAKRPDWHDASVHGAWPLSRLKRHFTALGFHAVGHQDDLLFVNEAQDVGFQCHGVTPHPTNNTWKDYYVEVQARRLHRKAKTA